MEQLLIRGFISLLEIAASQLLSRPHLSPLSSLTLEQIRRGELRNREEVDAILNQTPRTRK